MRWWQGLVTLGIVMGAAPAWCACEPMGDYRGTALKRFEGSRAYAYKTARMAVDADGAPNAYHPQNKGIDFNANAGFPNGGWRSVLVTDPANRARPFVQTTGPFAGFFLSMSTLQDKTKPTTDAARYVDATQVPYVVFPGAFFRLSGTGRSGVLGMARNLRTGAVSPMIFADVGPTNHELGEVSIRLAENLGGQNVSPKTGGGVPRGPFAYVIFPGSEQQPAWPVSAARMASVAEAELAKVGGWDAVLACLGG